MGVPDLRPRTLSQLPSYLVLFNAKKYNEEYGGDTDIRNKEPNEMGCPPSIGKLLPRRWPYSRRCEDGYKLADPERRGEACGYENKTRKGSKT